MIQFRSSRRELAVATLLVALAGCSMPGRSSTSTAKRDPFVMSHLTHSKEDPFYVASENEHHIAADSKETEFASASVARKSSYEVPSGDSPGTASHAADYSWLKGRLGYKRGKHEGWCIRYGAPGDHDRYGGELMFAETPRLGLLREGDHVRVQGELVPGDLPVERSYRVHSISLLE